MAATFVAATTLLITGAAPARAAAVAAFVGSVAVVPSLAFPVLGAPSSGTWDLSIDIGAGATSTGSAGGAGGGLTGTLAEGVITGMVGGPFAGGSFCGASRGTGGTGGMYIADQSISLSNVGWRQSGATMIVFTDQDGVLFGSSVVGVASVLPPTPASGTGSCVSGTATTFAIVGTLVHHPEGPV